MIMAANFVPLNSELHKIYEQLFEANVCSPRQDHEVQVQIGCNVWCHLVHAVTIAPTCFQSNGHKILSCDQLMEWMLDVIFTDVH